MLLQNVDTDNIDPDYKLLITNPKYENERKIVEELWLQFEPYADKNFVKEFSLHLHNRFWEMYLACTLLNQNLPLVPFLPKTGPDFCLKGESRNVWIEATSPTEGVGEDKVPTLETIENEVLFFCVPDEKIILRLISSIKDKSMKFLEYKEKGIINDGDALIIALNGGQVPFSYINDDIPIILQALFPIGNETIIISEDGAKIIDHGYKYRPEIKKQSGNNVSTKLFQDIEEAHVSGLLYSNIGVFNHPIEFGRDFLYIHNPIADFPLERGWFGIGKEYWVENNTIISKEY